MTDGKRPDEKKSEKVKKPGKKDSGKKKFHSARQSRIDPFNNIFDRHVENRLRMAKITIAVFLIMILFGVGGFLYGEWKKENRKTEKISMLKKALEEINEQMKNLSGYEKDKTAVIGMSLAEKARDFDIPNYREWIKVIQRYANAVSRKAPVTGSSKGNSFINATVFTDMVHIPAGQFFMGKRVDEYGLDDERPRHPVMISREFWISRLEITNAQFRRLFPNHHTQPWRNYSLDKADQPAVKIDWHVASAFCRMVTIAENKAGRLPKGYEYRLPTEAEWEYACRAGTETPYYWGSKFGNTGGKYANAIDLYSIKLRVFKVRPQRDMAINDGYRVSAPADSYKPNAFGLYNMSGNVSEWCYEWYNPKAYRELDEVDPVQKKPLEVSLSKKKPFDSGYYMIKTPCKVLRGGNYGNVPSYCRSARRDYAEPELKNTGIGFRMVLAPVIPAAAD